MSKYNSKINMEIIRALESNSAGDKKVFELIKELLLQEAFSEGKGQWKKSYVEKIEKYSRDWSSQDED
ncbi:MAG: hypothetical protein K8S14_09860 [Actinomycetia bacterium]|nr:hypothetical protein [Actinomycetes bacterium]